MNASQFEIIHEQARPEGRIKVAVFDFDGTFSTLRCGWEEVMGPLMLEMISGGPAENAPEALKKEVAAYIDESTGIQTVYQMQWLRDRVRQEGRGSEERDEWWYKAEYNRRLMARIRERIDRLEQGIDKPEQYLIAGAVDFLKALKARGVEVYLASGTDHQDVVHEATALKVAGLVSGIKGAPEHQAACSKEAVIRMILSEKQVKSEELLLVGDGKVEIALGKAAGAFALGAATDEVQGHGVNPVKKNRLLKAGADAVTGDFTELNAIMSWLGFEERFNGETEEMIRGFFSENPTLIGLRGAFEEASSRLLKAYGDGRKLLLCGNGGSAADCSHISGELLKGFLKKRPLPEALREQFSEKWGERGLAIASALQEGLPAIPLTENGAALSAFANDVDPELVYAQLVLAYGKPGDVLIGISTSGNAKNVNNAVKTASVLKMHTVALSGKSGGELKEISEISLIVPENETYRVQEAHLKLYHLLCAVVENERFSA